MGRRGRPRKTGVRNRKTGRRIRPKFSDEERVVLEKRCALMGRKATTMNLDKMRAPHLGDEAGRAAERLHRMASEEAGETITASDLWEAITHIRAVVSRYHRALDAPNPYPKGMRIEFEPEEVSAGPAGEVFATPLPRPEEESFRIAMRAFTNMDIWMLTAGDVARREVRSVVLEDRAPRDQDALVRGLVEVWRGMKGRRAA
jgi:hypothetical protein